MIKTEKLSTPGITPVTYLFPFFHTDIYKYTPYALPEELSLEAVTGFGKLDQHLTAQRYSDWTLGQFFSRAVDSPWFRDTLFVIVGDHGFAISRQLLGNRPDPGVDARQSHRGTRATGAIVDGNAIMPVQPDGRDSMGNGC